MSGVSVVVNAIGIIAGTLGIVGFTKANLPQNPTETGAIVRVGIGGGSSDLGGDRPYIVGYNEGGDAIGLTDGGDKVKDGAAFDMTLDQNAAGTDKTGQQPTYIQVSPSGKDEICIAYIAVTWKAANEAKRDGDLSRGWLGDIGDGCGYKSFASNLIVNDDGYKPKCVWLDQDGSNDIKLSAFQLHTEDFLAKSNDNSTINQDKNHYCTTPAMAWKTGGDDFKNGVEKRSIPGRFQRSPSPTPTVSTRSAYLDSKLVVSNDKQHSARELCSQDNSYGPDIVTTHEGYYCDMKNKREYPLCSETVKTRCFDLDSHTIQDGKRSVKREFKSVDNWN